MPFLEVDRELFALKSLLKNPAYIIYSSLVRLVLPKYKETPPPVDSNRKVQPSEQTGLSVLLHNLWAPIRPRAPYPASSKNSLIQLENSRHGGALLSPLPWPPGHVCLISSLV